MGLSPTRRANNADVAQLAEVYTNIYTSVNNGGYNPYHSFVEIKLEQTDYNNIVFLVTKNMLKIIISAINRSV